VALPATQTVSTQAADSNRVVASLQTDGAMPQPKAAVISTTQDSPAAQTTDVASAVKNLISPNTNVAATNLTARQDVVVTPVVDQPAAKSETNASTAKPTEVAPSVIELGLAPAKSELKVGDKQQLALRVKSDAPLGLALVMLRFDPKVLKITSISFGDLFANARAAPILTQSIDEHGMILLSLTPAAGSPVTANGALLNINVEAVGAGDSTLAFDLSNMHLVASDGRPLLLQIEPIKLTVK
jgi:hypothetical protein